ncbi:MAG: DUF366 family protein [Candidatus Gastranaerophilaceae bacterium]
MHTKFIDSEIKYTGLELSPHWIYKKFHLQGDAIVAFCGECEVKLTEMVDIEDVINNEPIYSKNMLSFIVEHFNIGLIEGVTRQRLLICIIKEVLEDAKCIIRKGDDLFIDGKKLSVSIATKSLTSVLIHVGLNIDPSGAPVDAAGLDCLGNCDIKGLAKKIMLKYSQEIDDIILASTKVTGR